MPKRATRTISFTPDQDSFLSDCLDSGRYQTASEVVRAGLRLLQHEQMRREAELERVRQLIKIGADQLDRGQTVSGEEVFARWSAKHERLRRGESSGGG